MDRAHPPVGLFAEQAYHRHAAMPDRNRDVRRRLAFDQFARCRAQAGEGSAQQLGAEATQSVVVKLLDLERQLERFGERENLVIVARSRAE